MSPAARGLMALRRFAAPPRAAGACDLCGAAIAEAHPHLLEADDRLSCACPACASTLGAGRHRIVPPLASALPELRLDDADWTALGVPVELAYFRRSSRTGGITATYPGPAGRVEALVPDAAWARLVVRAPALAALEPDVEALLARGPASWLVSVDRCVALVGALRAAPGDLDAATRSFFADLEDRCRS